MDTKIIHEMEMKHQDRGQEAKYEFSDRIVTLAAGLLGLSVSMRGWVEGHSPNYLCILKLAWVCMALSSVAGIIWRYSKVEVNCRMAQTIKPAVAAAVKAGAVSVTVEGTPSLFHRICFNICIYAFVVGIVTFTFYALTVG
jgi:hypothetical protein